MILKDATQNAAWQAFVPTVAGSYDYDTLPGDVQMRMFEQFLRLQLDNAETKTALTAAIKGSL